MKFNQYLDKYAELIMKVGLNYKKGSRIRIGALPGRSARFYTPLEAAPLVRKLTARAYQMGAPLVEVFWGDPDLDLIRYKNAPRDSITEMPTWSVNELIEATKRKDSRIYIGGSDPYKFKEIDSSLLSEMQKSRVETFREANEFLIQNPTPWIITLYPTSDWAQSVFPDLSRDEAEERLSDYLIKFYRLDKDDPIAFWKDHFTSLITRADLLTKNSYQYLHLQSPDTDLKIRLPVGHRWKSAVLKDKNGRENAVNMPSEEVFTVPDRMGVDGHVSSTKPFTMGDRFVQDMYLEFKDGKVIKAKAKTGEQFLKKTLEVDEGSCRLGELALVPNSSPISQANVIFHNILLDENASSHIALGRGIRECLEGGGEMSTDEFIKAGGNHSSVHYDFMIGSTEMDVDGYDKDGKAHPLMRNGEWAFDL